MSKGMNALVAITCVVVVCAVGFWTWKTLADQETAKDAAEARAFAYFCSTMLSDLEGGRGDYTLWHARRCVQEGHYSEADLNQRRLGHIVVDLKKLGAGSE